MRNKKVKELRRKAKEMESEDTVLYVSKVTQHTYTDPVSGNVLPYITQQTRMIPHSTKCVLKLLKNRYKGSTVTPWSLDKLKEHGYSA